VLWISAVVGASRAESAKKGAKASDAEQLAAALPADLLAALDLFDAALGPGQVAVPELTDAASQSTVLEHCAERNRVALLDPPAAANDVASLVAAAAALQSDTNARYGAMFAPYAIVPGVTGDTARTVPYSVVEAGIIARSDVTNNPNVPAAGPNGQALFATDLAQHFTDSERETLNEAGVDCARLLWGGVQTYGYRTLAEDGTPAAAWLSLGWARLNMAIVAQAEVVGERFVFRPIDGRGRTIAEFGGDLRAMLVPFYEQAALYGASAEDAFQVNVGSAVNTPETIANGELHAVLMVKMSPYAEWVEIEIVKVATTQALAA
jgi:phage tail sheath protein FI